MAGTAVYETLLAVKREEMTPEQRAQHEVHVGRVTGIMDKMLSNLESAL